MNKLFIVICCFSLLYLSSIKQNKNVLYKEIISLEKQYNDKLLIKYNIDPTKLHNVCSSQDNLPKCKKQYIMNNTNLSEKEYEDIFLHPIEHIKNAKDNIEDSYNNIVDKFSNISELIETLNN